MDNYGAHKHPKVQAWLQRHLRFVSGASSSDSGERWITPYA